MKKIGIFADGTVGNEVVKFLLTNYTADVELIVLKDENSEILNTIDLFAFNKNCVYFNDDLKNPSQINQIKENHLDFFILAWWPFIIKKNIFEIPKLGTINFHPSLLPYNRGKHYNFWTIVEESPFGVTLHYVDEGIDTGDILFQTKIEKDWTDTGETLYYKAQKEILNLFFKNYDHIRKNDLKPVKQNLNMGSFHHSKELQSKSKIDINQTMIIRDFLNLARAKTFPPHQGIWFEENGNTYEINLTIKKL